MSGNNLGFVLVRLFAIYLAVTALQSVFFVLPTLAEPSMDLAGSIRSIGFWLSVIAIMVPALCAYWIWQNVSLFVPEQAAAKEFSVTSAQLMFVGVSLLGLYFFAWGIVTLVRVESGLIAMEQVDRATKMAQRAPYVAQMLIAIPMLVGRRRLAEWLLRIKYSGTGRS